MIEFARLRFLDASALVKLLLYPDIKEDGSDNLANYRKNKTNFGTNTLCLAESLSTIKSKHFGSKKNRTLSIDGYLIIANRLKSILRNKTVRIFDIDYLKEDFINDAFSIVKKYHIDLSDAFQILSVKYGEFSSLKGKSQTLFITADKALAQAAKQEGISVWYCVSDSPPD